MLSITNIGLVNVDSEPLIIAADDAYNSLTDEQKTIVSNFDVLKKAKESYDQLKADEAVAAINAIGVVKTSSEKKIDFAFDLYQRLTDRQKALVGNFTDLLKAKDSFNLMKVNEVIKKIDQLGTITINEKSDIDSAKTSYDSLSEEQKKLVTNYPVIQQSYDEFSRLQIADVISLIDAIGEVNLNSSPSIETARKAYDVLNPSQKEFVTNYSKLELSTKDFSTAQINNVSSMIDAIGTPKVENKPKVIEARASYEKLDSGQKQEVTNYALLESIEQTITGLEVAEINKLIAGLNVNYPQKSDWDKCDKIFHLLENLPEIERTTSNFKDFDKFDKLYNMFQEYFKAVNYANNGQYEEAYNLMVTLNIMDSKQLAREYEKIVFKWWVEGQMTKSSYTRNEFFQIDFTVYGGKQDETINILYICSLPGAANSTDVLRDVSDGDSYWYKCWHPRPDYASQGIGKITFKNYSTGEVLGEFEFTVTYN